MFLDKVFQFKWFKFSFTCGGDAAEKCWSVCVHELFQKINLAVFFEEFLREPSASHLSHRMAALLYQSASTYERHTSIYIYLENLHNTIYSIIRIFNK